MPMMKGSAFTARFAYLKRRFSGRWDELVASFDAPTRALAHGPCLNASWYPFACFVDLNLKADRLVGAGDYALVREMGRDAAITNLPLFYKLFYKIGSVDFILGKAAALWRQHHDTGRAEVVKHADNHYEYRLYEFAAPHPTLCRSLEGFLVGTLEVMGMKRVDGREVECVLRGAPCCAFHDHLLDQGRVLAATSRSLGSRLKRRANGSLLPRARATMRAPSRRTTACDGARCGVAATCVFSTRAIAAIQAVSPVRIRS